MLSKTKHNNPRNIRTEKSLNNAMVALLERQNFGKITVRDICEEAKISRATFYAHFVDKYDLLRNWLSHLKPESMDKYDAYERIETMVNEFATENETIIRNLVCDADNETLDIISEFMLSTLRLTEKDSDEKATPKHIVLSNFCAGGMVYYLLWQIKNRFPPDVKLMNLYLYDMMEKLREWGAK